MAANTVLLDFSIEPDRVIDELSRKDVMKVIKENLEKYFGNLKIIYDLSVVDGGYLMILSDNTGVVMNVRFFNEGLITINIEYYKKEADPQRISFEVSDPTPHEHEMLKFSPPSSLKHDSFLTTHHIHMRDSTFGESCWIPI